MDNENKRYINSLLTLENISVAELAKKMTIELNKKYTNKGIYAKLSRDTLTLKECQAIAKILGYRIEFIKN